MKFFVLTVTVLLMLSSVFIFTSCESVSAQENLHADYNITVDVDDAENKVSVSQTTRITNYSDSPVKNLVFAFYPDAFTLKNPLPVDPSMLSAAYPYGINAGGYVFYQANGNDVESATICETPCKIEIELLSPLKNGDSTDINFDFDLTLPLNNARYGYNDFSINLTFFYPVLCRSVSDDVGPTRFVFYEYESTGDPFVFDCADYELTLNCPRDWAAICSAPEIKSQDGKTIFKADGLRDIALFMSPVAQISTITQNDYTVNVMHDGTREYAAGYALDALQIFSDAFCELPVKTYSLIFTPFMTSGAEFSNAAVICNSLSFTQTEKVVAHEVAHQWWYYLVGSDQVAAPWQDESLAQWSTLLYFDKKNMRPYADALRNQYHISYTDYVSSQRALGETASCDVFRATTDYRDYTDYYVTVYCKAAIAADIAAKSVTTDVFCKALSAYAKQYCLDFAETEDLFKSLDDSVKGLGGALKSSLSVSFY